MYYFVHIPKTGGTWFRKFAELNPQYNIETKTFHIADLFEATKPAIFCLRDPIDRFVSYMKLRWPKTRTDDITAWVDDSLRLKEQNIFNSSLTKWLGDIETYKQHEHKVGVVFDFNNYTNAVYSYFTDANRGIEHKIINPTQESVNKNKTKYDLRSDQLRELERIYAEDIKLYEYIKTRSYYASNES